MDSAPKPLRLHVPDAALADLKERLSRTRWPDEPPLGPWSTGTSLKYLQDLVHYWKADFDWRAQEARINRFRQFSVPIRGIELHFIHEPGRGADPMPLLLSHGWPGSIVEFRRLVPMLTDPARFGGDPADAFTVVAPSLPGYTFSFQPNQTRFSVPQMADLFATLMTDVLGYARFAAQGGDWGAFVTSYLGAAHADKLVGVHVNLLAVPRDRGAPAATPAPDERAYLEELDHWLREETGYQAIQGTKPQTLAYGLTDSPVGLAAWIVEKFRAWSDCDGDVERRFDKDTLLTNVMLYWVTGAINSSFWPYYARNHSPWPITAKQPVTAPAAYAAFPKEILHPPRAWVSRVYTDLRRWTEMKSGGHFAALEEPAALAEDVRAFFRAFR